MPRGRDPSLTRELLIRTGFKLYAERSIEDVTYQNIADACGVSMATIFRHFPHKQDLVTEIVVRIWNKAFDMIAETRPDEYVATLTAYDQLEFLLDCFIRIYEERPDLLRLSAGFDSYALKDNLSQEQLKAYTDAIQPLKGLLGRLYQKALHDHTVRTDIPEDEMFISTLYAIQGAAGRFACGTIWPPV